jgi:hypothetical protein
MTAGRVTGTMVIRLPAGGDDSCGHAAIDAGRLSIERDGIELALGPLQDFQPPGSPMNALR